MTRQVILAIDTTSEFGSVAIRAGGSCSPSGPCIRPMVSGTSSSANSNSYSFKTSISLPDIDCFAAAAGPGSFTGVRVGLTAAKGLAEVQHKPVAAISNLRALADFGSAPKRVVLLDARRGEVYAAVYGADLHVLFEETVAPLAAWLERLPAEPYEFITVAGSAFRAAARSNAIRRNALDGGVSIAGRSGSALRRAGPCHRPHRRRLSRRCQLRATLRRGVALEGPAAH